MNHTVIIRSDHTAAAKAIAWLPNNIAIVFRWRHSMAPHIQGEQQTGSKIANSARLWCLERLDFCGWSWPDTHQFTRWDFQGGWCVCTSGSSLVIQPNLSWWLFCILYFRAGHNKRAKLHLCPWEYGTPSIHLLFRVSGGAGLFPSCHQATRRGNWDFSIGIMSIFWSGR